MKATPALKVPGNNLGLLALGFPPLPHPPMLSPAASYYPQDPFLPSLLISLGGVFLMAPAHITSHTPPFTPDRPQRRPLNLHICCSLAFKYPFHHPLSSAPMTSPPGSAPSFPSGSLSPPPSLWPHPDFTGQGGCLCQALSPVTMGFSGAS